VSKTVVLGEWVHAHEQDKAGAKVYVGAGEPLPPSRGRHRLRFLRDGTFVESMPGADDRSAQSGGTYTLDGTKLVLQRAGQEQAVVYETSEGSGEKSLVLKKV
jgi:hypothetical protein